MIKNHACWAVLTAVLPCAAASAAPNDGVPIAHQQGFKPFHLSLAAPGVEITLPGSTAIYPQYIEFNSPARVAPAFADVYMLPKEDSTVRFTLTPQHGGLIKSYSWKFSCTVKNVSKLVIRRGNLGAADPAKTLTLEAAVTNGVATFTVPSNYPDGGDIIDVFSKPEYFTNKGYFAWFFTACDVTPAPLFNPIKLPNLPQAGQPKP